MGMAMKEIRDKEIKIRVTESEYDELLSRSRKPRLAEWMREHCLGAKVPRSNTVPRVDPDLLRQLAGMGNNLNQIARAVNSQGWKSLDRVQIVAALISIERELAGLREAHSDDS